MNEGAPKIKIEQEKSAEAIVLNVSEEDAEFLAQRALDVSAILGEAGQVNAEYLNEKVLSAVEGETYDVLFAMFLQSNQPITSEERSEDYEGEFQKGFQDFAGKIGLPENYFDNRNDEDYHQYNQALWDALTPAAQIKFKTEVQEMAESLLAESA